MSDKGIKLIFLDVDGVLNYSGCKDKIDGMRGIERSRVALLNKIIEHTGAVCVLSSTWRIVHPLSDMTRLLEERGFKGQLVDKTPIGSAQGRERGYEIDDWLRNTTRAAPIKSFIILDDHNDMVMWKHRLIQTDDDVGLTPHDVDLAIAALNEND